MFPQTTLRLAIEERTENIEVPSGHQTCQCMRGSVRTFWKHENRCEIFNTSTRTHASCLKKRRKFQQPLQQSMEWSPHLWRTTLRNITNNCNNHKIAAEIIKIKKATLNTNHTFRSLLPSDVTTNTSHVVWSDSFWARTSTTYYSLMSRIDCALNHISALIKKSEVFEWNLTDFVNNWVSVCQFTSLPQIMHFSLWYESNGQRHTQQLFVYWRQKPELTNSRPTPHACPCFVSTNVLHTFLRHLRGQPKFLIIWTSSLPFPRIPHVDVEDCLTACFELRICSGMRQIHLRFSTEKIVGAALLLLNPSIVSFREQSNFPSRRGVPHAISHLPNFANLPCSSNSSGISTRSCGLWTRRTNNSSLRPSRFGLMSRATTWHFTNFFLSPSFLWSTFCHLWTSLLAETELEFLACCSCPYPFSVLFHVLVFIFSFPHGSLWSHPSPSGSVGCSSLSSESPGLFTNPCASWSPSFRLDRQLCPCAFWAVSARCALWFRFHSLSTVHKVRSCCWRFLENEVLLSRFIGVVVKEMVRWAIDWGCLLPFFAPSTETIRQSNDKKVVTGCGCWSSPTSHVRRGTGFPTWTVIAALGPHMETHRGRRQEGKSAVDHLGISAPRTDKCTDTSSNTWKDVSSFVTSKFRVHFGDVSSDFLQTHVSEENQELTIEHIKKSGICSPNWKEKLLDMWIC